MITAPPASGCSRITVHKIPRRSLWYRFNLTCFHSALFFDEGPNWRWNSPDGSFGSLYLADSYAGAFSESYGHEVTQHSPAVGKFRTEEELRERNVFVIQPKRILRVAEFHGKGLAKLNLDANIFATTDYDRTRDWARWVYQCPGQLDGILYHSRLLPTAACLVLFDHCATALEENNQGPVFEWSDPHTGINIFDVMTEQGWGLI